MLLEISTTHAPATDLGFLLEKHPARVQEFGLAGGKAIVYYREATTERCTVALLLDIDPIGLVRGKGPGSGDAPLQQYVNDRPYVASSFLSVALGTAFRSALAGKSRHRPELAVTAIPVEVRIPALPCRGGEFFLKSLFEPLGYQVEATRLPLDTTMPEWGESNYFSVTLRGDKMLRDVLQHLYVLIPVLDDQKHYWVGDAEVDKLVRHAGEWLGSHPAREAIARRYLKHKRSLARDALSRLTVEEEEEGEAEAETAPRPSQSREQILEEKISLNQRRIDRITEIVQRLGAVTLVDLGCGEGKVLSSLFKVKALTRLLGMDVSMRALEIASERLNFDRLPPRQRERIALMHGSLIYRDKRLSGFDVATVIEVIEHLDAARLSAFERVLFEFARPVSIVLTTPNSEYNVKFPSLAPGQFRHADHRFEWTRAEFQAWANRQAASFGYQVTFEGIGDVDETLGTPTQVGIFTRAETLMPAGA